VVLRWETLNWASIWIDGEGRGCDVDMIWSGAMGFVVMLFLAGL
jgi:hypothetical protein